MFKGLTQKEMRDLMKQIDTMTEPATTIHIDIDDLLYGKFLSPEFQALQERARHAFETGGKPAVRAMLKVEGR